MNENTTIYEMVSYNLRVAKELLEEYGEFYPIACIRKNNAEVSNTVAVYFENEMPESIEVIQRLIDAINTDEYRADLVGACICVNVEDIQSSEPALDFWVNILGFDAIKITWHYKMEMGKMVLLDIKEDEGIMFLRDNNTVSSEN